MIYYRRYVGDFQRDTGHLSLIEVGAYDRLLDHVYATEVPLPSDMNVLLRICRAVTPDERAAVELVADTYFPVNGDGNRHNKRAVKEINVSQTARENGTAGGRPKTKKVTGEQTQERTETRTGSGHPSTTNHHPSTFNLQPSEPGKARATRWPADQDVPQGWIGEAMGWQPTWTIDHAMKIARMFKNYWVGKSGKDATKLDWHGTWENWVLKEPPMKDALSGKPQKPWFLQWDKIRDKAKELKLTQLEDEPDQVFKERVYEAAGLTPEQFRNAKKDWP